MAMRSNLPTKAIEYPESDGKPMSDNTRQYSWIVTIQGGFDAFLPDFVGGNILWYPVEGKPTINLAPDVLIALGRPKGHRGSYKQWEEGRIAPQVVFEVWSPGNDQPEMTKKRGLYEQFGVIEYYEFDPDRIRLKGWHRQNDKLIAIGQMQGWVSPLTKVRFELDPKDLDNELKLYEPSGKRFLSYLELSKRRDLAEFERNQARLRAAAAEFERDQAETRATTAEQQLQQLIAKLKAAGLELP